ncbi:DNA-binding transcriptional response regulator [Luteibacter sahnii]|uniref:hypothetical protein n=1 Tax=Luteibacter sahnii TaxID=3021977 RepID=UPI002A6A0348|nr:hypothetical protein [Luteibacter sp. PPL193]MDY1549436.1 hypothetical protein [Luteibacter sp. PPL193]
MTTPDDNPTFRTLPASALAVVIEPRPTVADTVADCLRSRGYDVRVASSHSGAAASVIEREPVHILIAAVPAPGDDRSGAYLARARATHPGMAIVIMLSDPDEPAENAPLTAIRLVKPFDKAALARSIDAACAIA